MDVNIGGWGWGGHQHGWVEVGWTSTLNTTCEIVVLATPLQNIEAAASHAYEHSTVIAVSCEGISVGAVTFHAVVSLSQQRMKAVTLAKTFLSAGLFLGSQ